MSAAVFHPCASAGEVCYVGLGANLGDRHHSFDSALELMPGVVEAQSPRYETVPIGPPQPSFLNAAVRLRTALAPLQLLEALLAIERTLGRDRAQETRWGPRTLDLDLLLYGGRRLRSARLTVPHPRMHGRAFVLRPLADVAPEAVIPGRGLARRFLRRLADQRIASTRTHALH